MTHPGGGSGGTGPGGGGGTGPGRDVPLTPEARLETYYRQNGTRRLDRLTSKQWRRLTHKTNRALARAL